MKRLYFRAAALTMVCACTETAFLGTAEPLPEPELEELEGGRNYFVTIAWGHAITEEEWPAWPERYESWRCPADNQGTDIALMPRHFRFEVIAALDSLPAAVVLPADLEPPERWPNDSGHEANEGPMIVFADGDGDGEFDQPYPDNTVDYPVSESVTDDIMVEWRSDRGARLVKRISVEPTPGAEEAYEVLPDGTPVYFYRWPEEQDVSAFRGFYGCAATKFEISYHDEPPADAGDYTCETDLLSTRWTEHLAVTRRCVQQIRTGLMCDAEQIAAVCGSRGD